MSDDSFVAKLAEMKRVPVEEVTDDTAITPAEWDSVDVLDLIAAMDESFGVTVAIAALNECSTVGQLRGLIRTAAANA